MALPVPVFESRLREDSRVSIRSTLCRGWEFLKTDFWPILGIAALVCVLGSITIQFYVTALFLLGPAMAGGMYYFVLRVRGERPSIEMVFLGFKQRFGDLAIVNLVTIAPMIPLVIVSFVLLIFNLYSMVDLEQSSRMTGALMSAGIWTAVILVNMLALSILMQFTYFASVLCLDHNLSAKASLKLTWAATKRHGMKIILFATVWFVLAMLSTLVLYVGVFFCWAVFSVSNAYLYEDLFQKRHTIAAQG